MDVNARVETLLHDAPPFDRDGGVSLLEGVGLRMTPAPGGSESRCYILNDKGAIARIEETTDGKLIWYGHWLGGRNRGIGDGYADVLGDLSRHFLKIASRFPWRVMAWPMDDAETAQ